MLKLVSGDPGKFKCSAWVIPVCENAALNEDKFITDLVDQAKKLADFKGKPEEQVLLYGMPGVVARQVIFAGLGKKEEIQAESLRKAAGRAIKTCLKNEVSEALMMVPNSKNLAMEPEKILKALLEGACLANQVFDAYKGEKKQKPLKEIGFFTDAETAEKNRALLKRVEDISHGTFLARQWVTMPSNDKKPALLAAMMKKEAEKEKLKVTVLDEKQLKQQKFGAMLAVAQGSANAPGLVIMEYRVPKAKKTIALVGKGVTFDSGGINIKPSAGMEEMKTDMAGAAAVAGALIAIARIKPKVNVVGVMPLVENMPSGSATRPGDVIRSYSGKTVEIGNTDAEGRLILIDALAYTLKKYKPHTIIDMATLTGACVVALGDKIAGVFSPDQTLAKAIVDSGTETWERCWQLPMPEDYKELLKSDIADIHNMSSSRYGGAITAALFLADFVGDARWAHIDIAGPSYSKKPDAYCSTAGTGFGVRLLCDLLEKL
ncbi:MAG: leucyl aminopeptidase [Desulfobacteraceae bacterium]|nr:leucyl aminopeptidase [Desulfobacteraceae bacterium]